MTDDGDRKIKRSRMKCHLCDTVVESKSRHDFVSCKCKSIFLDGGLDYVRYGYSANNDFTMMTEYYDE
jgi:hypothetical protein